MINPEDVSGGKVIVVMLWFRYMGIDKSALESDGTTIGLSAADEALLFEDSQLVRPTIQALTSLVVRGATEADLLAAGERRNLTAQGLAEVLKELDTITPHLHTLTEELADRYNSRRLVFAGRDAEVLHDSFRLRYPDHPAILMPASTDMWYSFGMDQPDIAKGFMDAYGLDAATVHRDEAVLVDTGFQGTIGYYVWRCLARLHTRSFDFYRRRVPIKLVAVSEDALWGQQLVDFGLQQPNMAAKVFPRASTSITPSSDRCSVNLCVATSLQLMPRYHGHFRHVERELDGSIVVKPETMSRSEDINAKVVMPNQSIVNPLAAAIVQHRLISQALGIPTKRTLPAIS